MYKFSQIEKLLKLKINPIKKTEVIKTTQASGRFLAEDLYSTIDIPPANNSAVDGFLFKYKRLISNSSSKTFLIDSEIHAGEKPKDSYLHKNTIKVSTGSHIPKGFDVIIMEEDFVKKNNLITLNKKKDIFKWMNIRKRGEDIKKDQKVFSSGHCLSAQDIGMLSSIGLDKVKVTKKVKVGILSNGNELIEPGKKKLSYQIYDSNRYTLYSLLKENYTLVTDFGIIKDDYKKIKEKLISVKNKSDLIIISGGASSGSRDYVVKIIREIGIINFWKVSIKPGRPFGLGILKQNKPILILPGNPVACFVIFFIFGKKLLNFLMGNFSYKPKYYLVKSNFSMKKKIGREEFLRGKTFIKNGKMYVNKFNKQGAGILSSIIWSNGLIRLKSSEAYIKKNSDLEFYPFNNF